jgi:signal peptidase I
MKVAREYFLTILLAVVSATLLRVFVVESYRVPSTVMAPTLQKGDTILVLKTKRAPARGDIFVYANPHEAGAEYVRRVVGLPGDLVEVRKGDLWLNGQLRTQSESLAVESNCVLERLENRQYQVCGFRDLDLPPVRVPSDQYYLLADERHKREDATGKSIHQLVSKEVLRGKVLTIWFSWISSRIRFDRMFRSV